ncbi:glycoside hydrolase family 57 protein [Sulfurimonas sp.]
MNLSFIWHMHQPDYRDTNGIMQMPWVFLHAIKDYYDMPWMLSRHENIKATFNITPTLIQQLKLYYKAPQDSDKFLFLWLKDPSQLQETQRKWLIKICKTSQYETMVEPLNRYKVLYRQERFDNSELIDLEVLFVLSWCGVYLKTKNLIVKELIEKEKDYTQEDKQQLLDTLASFIAQIFDYYKELHSQKRITIATTPFFHPILPLLMDMKNAQNANPNTKIPQNHMTLEEDARLHIVRSKKLFRETFGFEADGFWPAEGAVDSKSVALLTSLGIRWIATDEAILYKSLHVNNKNLIYKPYTYNKILIAFRDHYLSDLIGFQYRYKDAQAAADDFIQQLQKIQNTDTDNTAFIILDGENAWEFYKNNGFDFFEALYKNLNNLSWCNTRTMDEVKNLPCTALVHLAAGSWINGTFDTWVGNSQKTRAWELLFQTKKDYRHHKTALTQDTNTEITNHFLAAECSDWFWWYGEDHYTDFSEEFDTLFRSHLIEIYKLIGISPPQDLFIPIINNQSFSKFWIRPQSDITPVIDGRRDSFFEWMGCGTVDESKVFSTMEGGRGPVKKIYYGQDEKALYFSFEGTLRDLCQRAMLNIVIDPLNLNLKIAFNGGNVIIDGVAIQSRCQDYLEFSINKKMLGHTEIFIRFELNDGIKTLQTLPSFGELQINLNDDYSQNWFV